MHLRLDKLLNGFFVLVFSFVIMGMTSRASFSSDNYKLIKKLGPTVEFVKIHAEEEDDEEDSDDEEEERF